MGHALIVVDYQNDFTPPDGALAVAEGDQIAERINALARSGDYDLVVATRDWHPPDHGSFTERGGTWPVHCVADSPGAELHPALDTAATAASTRSSRTCSRSRSTSAAACGCMATRPSPRTLRAARPAPCS